VTEAAVEGLARGTLSQRLRARLIALGADVIARLPERPLIRLAELAGGITYHLAPARREQARRNLRRVAEWLAAHDLGSPEARRAAGDDRALDALVRSAFRHHGRYWLELIRAGRMSSRYIDERVLIETPELLAEAVEPGRASIFVGLHFGAIELPGFYLGHVGRTAVGPMESVGDPALQRWFLETRAAMGVRLVGLREARRELVAALRRGGAVGVVADRDLTGGGIPRPFFGADAPLAAGPALLVLETGASAYAVAVRRSGPGRYRARLERLAMPAEGARRARVEAFVDAQARAFERLVADAPAQWWGVFHPIWPDLVVGTGADRP
jgi:phosphatidylinositol dimannoside acyltransferase